MQLTSWWYPGELAVLAAVVPDGKQRRLVPAVALSHAVGTCSGVLMDTPQVPAVALEYLKMQVPQVMYTRARGTRSVLCAVVPWLAL